MDSFKKQEELSLTKSPPKQSTNYIEKELITLIKSKTKAAAEFQCIIDLEEDSSPNDELRG